MQTKLTLRMDDELIAAANEHAKSVGKSLSQLVAEYLAALSLDEVPEGDSSALTTTVARLRGCLKGADLDVEDYRAHPTSAECRSRGDDLHSFHGSTATSKALIHGA